MNNTPEELLAEKYIKKAKQIYDAGYTMERSKDIIVLHKAPYKKQDFNSIWRKFKMK